MSKIKILFVAANPAGTPAVKLDKEMQQITAKIRAAEYRDSLDVRSAWAARPDDLMQHLLEFKPHIVHFSGHGERGGELNFLDDAGNRKLVSVQAIRSLFRVLKDNVRLVVFNACFAKAQAEAVVEFIDCAVGMNTEVSDEAAIAFAGSFYRAIGFGRSVQESFDLGVTSILFDVPNEATTPEIVTRKGVDANAIVLVNPNATVVPTPVPTPTPLTPDGIDRVALVKTLGQILPSQLTFLTAILNMPGIAQLGGGASHAEKIHAFVSWAEAPGGVGLVKVKAALDELIRNPQ